MDDFFRTYLKAEFSRRVQSNSNYSLRAFARSLHYDVGALSKLLSGKKSLSIQSAKKMCDSLGLGPTGQERFLKSIIETKARESLQDYLPKNTTYQVLESDKFTVISNWFYFAIRALTEVQGFKNSPSWISKKLGISVPATKTAIEKLEKLGLLISENGTLKKKVAHITTADKNMTNLALKKHQRLMLEKAIVALDRQPIERRNSTGVTMAIDPKKIPLAKRLIQDFSRHLCEVLESGSKKEVYQLSVNLFSLENEEGKR